MQFINRTVPLYPVERMPHVSDDNINDVIGDDNDGSHVGLMQVVTNKARAWNWLENTEYGVGTVFKQKFRNAYSYYQGKLTQDPTITKLTPKQLEENAVGKYGDHAELGWYWTWNGVDKWDPTINTPLKNYVDDVVSRAQ